MGRLVSRTEAEPLLGLASGSLKALMHQQPDRWPDPVVRGRGPRPHLYTLDTLRAAMPTGATRTGRAATLDGAAESIECLYCGRRYRNLGPHLARTHGTTAAEYRAEHRLPATAALMAGSMREALHDIGVVRAETDPRVRAALVQDAETQRARAELSALARAATDGNPLVVAARRRALDRDARPRRVEAWAEARYAAARRAGYPDWRAAIEATRYMARQQAADRLGVGRTTITRWRTRLS